MGVGAVLMVVACDCCGEEFILTNSTNLICSGCSKRISRRRKKKRDRSKFETPKGYPDDKSARRAVGKLLKSYSEPIVLVHKFLDKTKEVPKLDKNGVPERFPSWVSPASAK